MELTKLQKELMAHTISGPNRNWFDADADSRDSKSFEGLVKEKFATKEQAPEWMGGGIIYRLTSKGKEALAVNSEE